MRIITGVEKEKGGILEGLEELESEEKGETTSTVTKEWDIGETGGRGEESMKKNKRKMLRPAVPHGVRVFTLFILGSFVPFTVQPHRTSLYLIPPPSFTLPLPPPSLFQPRVPRVRHILLMREPFLD